MNAPAVGPDVRFAAKGRLEPDAVEPGFAYLESIVATVSNFVWDVH